MHLVYAVSPSPAGDAPDQAAPSGVEVTVSTDGNWRLVGVLGGRADVATTASRTGSRRSGRRRGAARARPVGSAEVAWRVPSEVN